MMITDITITEGVQKTVSTDEDWELVGNNENNDNESIESDENKENENNENENELSVLESDQLDQIRHMYKEETGKVSTEVEKE